MPRLPACVAQTLAADLLTQLQSQPTASVKNSVYSQDFNTDLSDLLPYFNTQEKAYIKRQKAQTEYLFLGLNTHWEFPINKLETFKEISVKWTQQQGCQLIGGVCFSQKNPQKQDVWENVSDCHFYLPLIQLKKHKQTLTLTYTPKQESTTHPLQVLKNVLDTTQETAQLPEELINSSDTPTKDQWHHMVNKVLHDIHARKVEKVVLARESTLTFKDPINPSALVTELVKHEPNCSVYFHQYNNTFLSVTPETLFLRQNHNLQSDIIAGTTAKGNTTEESQKLATLLQQHKERQEHGSVLTAIQQVYQSLCEDVSINDKHAILQLSQVQHLKTQITGTLADNTLHDLDILTALHPTPATGGTPKQVALNTIDRLEPFNRGWYAGAVGMIGNDETEFFVAIRSCVITQNRLHVFVGAGIVQGSKPEQEWDELNHKMKNYLSLFPQPA